MNQPLTFKNCKSHAPLVTDHEASWIPSNPLIYLASHCGSEYCPVGRGTNLGGPLFQFHDFGRKSKKEVALSHIHSIPLRFWTVELIALEPMTIPSESNQIEQKNSHHLQQKSGGLRLLDNVKCWVQSLLGWSVCASLCKPRVPGLGTSTAALPCELKSDSDREKDPFLQTWEATSEIYQHHVSPSWSLYQRLLLAGILPNHCPL